MFAHVGRRWTDGHQALKQKVSLLLMQLQSQSASRSRLASSDAKYRCHHPSTRQSSQGGTDSEIVRGDRRSWHCWKDWANAMWGDPQIEIGSLYVMFVSGLPELKKEIHHVRSVVKHWETGDWTYPNKVGLLLLPFAFLWSHNKFHQIEAAWRLLKSWHQPAARTVPKKCVSLDGMNRLNTIFCQSDDSTWVDSVEKSSPPPPQKKKDNDGLWYLLDRFYFLPSTIHGVSHWWMSPDTTRFHQVTPCCSCEMPWDAAARGTIFVCCGQVVKLFPVSISLPSLLQLLQKFKKFWTVFLKDVWFSTMFQHLTNWSSQKLGTYP